MIYSTPTYLSFSPSAAFEFLLPTHPPPLPFPSSGDCLVAGVTLQTKSGLSHRSVDFKNIQTFKGKEVCVTGVKAHT